MTACCARLSLRPEQAEAADFTGAAGVAPEVESVLTMKPNWADKCAGRASRSRDNIGAPVIGGTGNTIVDMTLDVLLHGNQ